GFVAATIELVAVAEVVDFGRAVSGADGNLAKAGLQRFEQGLAQHGAGGDGQIGIFRDVGHAIGRSDLGIEEIAKEEIFAELDPSQSFERSDCSRLAHADSHYPGESCAIMAPAQPGFDWTVHA